MTTVTSNPILGYVIIAVIIMFILGKILKSRDMQTEWGRFKPFSMKFWLGLAVVIWGYIWAGATEVFNMLGGLF